MTLYIGRRNSLSLSRLNDYVYWLNLFSCLWTSKWYIFVIHTDMIFFQLIRLVHWLFIKSIECLLQTAFDASFPKITIIKSSICSIFYFHNDSRIHFMPHEKLPLMKWSVFNQLPTFRCAKFIFHLRSHRNRFRRMHYLHEWNL